MYLGVVMMGNGAHAAASVGVLQALLARGVVPYAVCGIQGGAIPAALYLSGMDADELQTLTAAAAGYGRRLLPLRRFAGRALCRRGEALLRDEQLERMLIAGTGGRVLSVCPRTGAVLCRLLRTGRRVSFATRAYPQESGTMLNMQVSAGFAARAAAALPPFLAPMSWMGSPLLPETDAAFACRQLFLLGAQRVLVIRPCLSPRSMPDAMDLTGTIEQSLSVQGAGVLHVQMPDGVGALSFDKMPACLQAGKETAQRELDHLFEAMGMAFCRVLPFRGIRR